MTAPIAPQALDPVVTTASYSAYLNFLEQIKKEGLSRDNKFQVLINVPAESTGTSTQARTERLTRRLQLLCDSVVFPGKTLNTSERRINTLSAYVPNSIDYQEDVVTMSFYIDAKFKILQYFNDWVSSIIDYKGENSTKLSNYHSNYATKIDLLALASDVETIQKPIMKISLYDAFPVSVDTSEFSYSNPNVSRMTVKFVFKHWEISYDPDTTSEPPKLFTKNTLNNSKKRSLLIVKIFLRNGAVILKRAFLKKNSKLARIIRKIDSVPLGNFRKITRRF